MNYHRQATSNGGNVRQWRVEMSGRRTSRVLNIQIPSLLECSGLVARWPMLRSIMATGIWIVLATVIAPTILSAQAAGCPSVGQPGAFLCSLDADAQRAADPAGDLNYATELIHMMASHLSRDDVAVLARRVALADQAARRDPGKYIPETAVAAAFNGLMAKVLDKKSPPISSDAQTVHRIREVLADNSHALISVKEHPASCLPDEAVLLVFFLIFDNGRVISVPPGQPVGPALTAVYAEQAANDAYIKLDGFLAAHSTWRNMTLLNKLLYNMGI